MGGHHLVLGEIRDYLTDKLIVDTHDERYRQNIARILITRKGYARKEISARNDLLLNTGEKRAVVKNDFQIVINQKICMIVRYAPGSLVTRHRPAIAASRLTVPYQIPVVVVTNGEDAHILDGSTGTQLRSGLDSIPHRNELLKIIQKQHFSVISEERALMESRILYAFEIDDSCPCDDTVCRLKE